jgi:hypothetical protein
MTKFDQLRKGLEILAKYQDRCMFSFDESEIWITFTDVEFEQEDVFALEQLDWNHYGNVNLISLESYDRWSFSDVYH